VLSAAAARGWRLAQVRAEIDAGRWPGLAGLYALRREPGQIAWLLPREWRKQVTWLAEREDNRAAEYEPIRRWVTAADLAIGDPARTARWGRRAVSVRLVLAALGQAAMATGSCAIELGTRNLALQAGVSHRAAAGALQLLRDEDDPLIDLVSSHRVGRADLYQLRIPDAYAAALS
jgi:hypothetical protein